jgi:hypothetical protein
MIFALGLAAGLAGCSSLGYNKQSLNNSLTPNVTEKQYTRTWQPTGQPGQYSQNVTSGPTASASDPAYPNYMGTPQSAPPATATGK